MDGRMIEDLVYGVIAIGIIIGIALCAIGYGIYWLITNVNITIG